MCTNLKADVKRFIGQDKGYHSFKEILYLCVDQGFWAVLVYRFGRWAHQMKVPIVSLMFRILAFVLFKLIELTTGISVPASVEIGPGFYIGHFGGIILHSDVKIGKNCSIGPGVVIGTRGLGNKGTPIIGDDVYIGVGAKILGGVKIGNRVRIGANSVVLKDIPDGATAVGIPAKIVRKEE